MKTMVTEKKNGKFFEGEEILTTKDLSYIIDVNKKAIEINIEVEKQNEQILKEFFYLKGVSARVEEQLIILKRNEDNISKLLEQDNYKAHEEIFVELDKIKEKFEQVLFDNKENKRIVDDHKKLSEDSKKLFDEIKRVSEETNKIMKDTVEKKVEDIEKNLFRLIIILGSAGVGTLVTIIQSILHK